MTQRRQVKHGMTGKASVVRPDRTSYPDARAEPTLLEPGEPGLSVIQKGDAVRFAVHARPRAKESAVMGIREGALDVRLAAPPVEGLANEELVRTIAEALGTSRQSVQLVRGKNSREKLVEVAGLSVGEAIARLERHFRGAAPEAK